MTLELNQVAPQVKAMGQRLAQQQSIRADALQQAQALLAEFSDQQEALTERILRAEEVQQRQRFDWVGAAPTAELLARSYPLPASPERLTVVASDGSQIYPDQHAIMLYYLINVGSIVYQHGSGRKPQTYNLRPILGYEPEDVLDEQGRLISASEVSVRRDLKELEALVQHGPAYARQTDAGPVVGLMDGQLTLRVIDLPFHQQQSYQEAYIDMLNNLREAGVLLAGYIDRPRSSFALALLHLASLELAQISEETLRRNPFRRLTDLDLFRDLLGPGERSAVFMVKAKGLEKYNQAGHTIHFFYLNVSRSPLNQNLARVEIPGWIAAHPAALDLLHAAIVRQARITGSYPYVLARADELAVISGEEREAVEMMLAIELRRRGLKPEISLKQHHKNAFRAAKESFKL